MNKLKLIALTLQLVLASFNLKSQAPSQSTTNPIPITSFNQSFSSVSLNYNNTYYSYTSTGSGFMLNAKLISNGSSLQFNKINIYKVVNNQLQLHSSDTIASDSTLLNGVYPEQAGSTFMIEFQSIASSCSNCSNPNSTIDFQINSTQQTTTPGMVRLFILDNSGLNNAFLFSEVEIPAITQGSTLRTFSCQALSGSFNIPPGYSIIASTQNGETFSVVIEGADWLYV